MQLSEFTYIFLTLCIPFLIYIVRSTNPKKGFSILFVAIISANIFLIFNNFSQIGLFFLRASKAMVNIRKYEINEKTNNDENNCDDSSETILIENMSRIEIVKA